MRIPHGYASNFPFFSINRHRPPYNLTFRKRHRNSLRCKFGLSHIHGDTCHLSILHLHLQDPDPAPGLHGDLFFSGQTAVIQVFAHAADSIAAHFTLTAVLIKDPHPGIRARGRLDQNDPIPADSKVISGQSAAERLRICYLLLKTIKINIIIPTTMHLGKLQLHRIPPFCNYYIRTFTNVKKQFYPRTEFCLSFRYCPGVIPSNFLNTRRKVVRDGIPTIS